MNWIKINEKDYVDLSKFWAVQIRNSKLYGSNEHGMHEFSCIESIASKELERVKRLGDQGQIKLDLETIINSLEGSPEFKKIVVKIIKDHVKEASRPKL